jgi:hypothetical protein
MWFSIYDYENFLILSASTIGETWKETFNNLGFKTYQVDYGISPMGKCHWLDDHEFTFFVLRYS